MRLAELFPEGGRGVIATADAAGVVNQAVFAIPHVVDEQTLAWGFSEGRTIANLRENPHASYLYLAPSRGYNGWRLTLTMKEEAGEGEMLENIRERTAQVASLQASAAVTRVAYFKVEDVRPLM